MKGLNEMSLSELHREVRMALRGDAVQLLWRVSWIYYLTFVLPVAPLVLAMFALMLIAQGTRRVMVIAVCAAYYAVLLSAEAFVYEGLSFAAGAWISNVIFAVAAAY